MGKITHTIEKKFAILVLMLLVLQLLSSTVSARSLPANSKFATEFEKNFELYFTNLQWNKNNTLIAGVNPHSVIIIDKGTQTTISVLISKNNYTYINAFWYDENTMYTITLEGHILIWNISVMSTPQLIDDIFLHSSIVYSSISSNKKYIGVVDYSSLIWLFNCPDFTLNRVINGGYFQFSPDNTKIACTNQTNTTIYDINTKVVKNINRPSNFVTWAFNSDVLISSNKNVISITDVANNNETTTSFTDTTAETRILNIDWNPTYNLLVFGNDRGAIHILDTQNNTITQSLSFSFKVMANESGSSEAIDWQYAIPCVKWSSDGQEIMACASNYIKVWSIQTDQFSTFQIVVISIVIGVSIVVSIVVMKNRIMKQTINKKAGE